jgi:tRNA1(Val) A37 N6-methylase TrmN6
MNNSTFQNKYNYFDLVFFSPPYYKMELYPGDKQSTSKYNNYDTWLKIYWEKTIQLCLHVLSPGSKMCYILSGYGSKNTKFYIYLIDDMNKIAEKYFTLKK